MREILAAESKAIAEIPYSENYDKAVELIVERVYRRGGKLVTSGMGKAGQIALNIATTFSSTGIPAVNLHPSEAQHGDLGVVQENEATEIEIDVKPWLKKFSPRLSLHFCFCL